MARYIDADALIEALQADYDREGAKADETALKGLYDISVKYSHGQFCLLNAIERVKDTPTADVAPKSEVDDLKRYIILNEDIAIKCKRENGEQNEEYWKGKISAFKQIRAYIDAELKKKYTESEGNV